MERVCVHVCERETRAYNHWWRSSTMRPPRSIQGTVSTLHTDETKISHILQWYFRDQISVLKDGNHLSVTWHFIFRPRDSGGGKVPPSKQ